MTLMERRRALMGQKDSNILWEWTPEKGLSNIGFTASSGETPSYVLRSDCIRLKTPNQTSVKQTRLTIPNPPIVSGKAEIEVHIKNFPINGYNGTAVAVYLCGYSFAQKTIYCMFQGSGYQAHKFAKIGGTQAHEIQYTGNETEFTLRLSVDMDTNSATAYLPNGQTLLATFSETSSSKTAVSIEGKSNAYFDITKIVIRRVTA
jgi:hypothetical protein